MHSHDLGLAGGGWGADWPNGYGFLDELVNGNTIAPTGNTNISEINDPVINNLFTKSQHAHRRGPDGDLVPDRRAGHEGRRHPARGVPEGRCCTGTPATTNVYVQAYYGMYNYAVMGVKS